MPGQSALPDLLVEIAFTPDPSAGFLRATFGMPSGPGQHDYYADMTALDDYTIQAGDYLEYDIWWVGALQCIAVELGFSDTSYLRNYGGVVDQNGLSAAPNTDIGAFANGQWYHRKIAIGGLAGRTITKWEIACDQGAAGLGSATFFNAQLRDVAITDGTPAVAPAVLGTVKANVWRQTDGVPTVTVDIQDPASGSTLTLSRINEPPVWTDVTAYFRRAQIQRGKGADLEPTSPGTLSLELENRDRRFDPTNAASPYYPNMIPGRRIRISASKFSTYRRFTGFIKSVPPAWQGRDAYVTLEAVDGFDFLGARQISGFRAVEASGPRIRWALDQAGWPTDDRSIDAGLSQVEQSGSSTGTLLDNVAALEHLQDIADAELGDFFIRGDGYAIFRQRTTRLMQYSSSQGTYSNAPGPGEFLFTDWAPSYQEDAVFNEVRVRPIAATTDSVASDYDSARRFGLRTLPRTVWLTTLVEALAQAQYLLGGRKAPALQVDSIHLEPKRQDTLWDQALARDIGDRITIKFLPYGGGSPIVEDGYVEGISESIDASGDRIEWSLDFTVSPADTQVYWILGDANESLLGVSTVLGY